jgi:dethiobiotin synthetase
MSDVLAPPAFRPASLGFFVTGTDTGVGKTLVSCALLHAFARRNLRVVGMKPVAAGARIENGRLVNDDVTALSAASTVAAPADAVNPYCFAPPVAPHIAAAEAGVVIEIDRLRKAYITLAGLADCVIVEGAGGFRVPLGRETDIADLAASLALPVVLVVGLRLGCINHALLSAEAISRVGLTLAGWVANRIDQHMMNVQENVETLQQRLRAPLLGRLAYCAVPDIPTTARAIDVDPLLIAARSSG